MNVRTICGSLERGLTRPPVSRREAVSRSGRMAAALALGSMPLTMGVFATRAPAQGTLPAEIVEVLNFVLTLEYLEDEFYRAGLDADSAGNLDLGDSRAVFQQIAKHEAAHVALLQGLLGADAAPRPSFDFTAGGSFPDVFTNSATFIALAQGLEDAGVRAYKGQLVSLMSNPEALTTALRIHSVEARHAAEVRRLALSPGDKGWITLAENSVPALDPVYAGEEVTTQAGVDLTQFGTAEAASEAFDEPLTREQVEAVASLFITS
jgi:rubrerythrin